MITSCTESRFIEFVSQARKSLLCLSPGYTEAMASAIRDARDKVQSSLCVFIDLDPDVIRMGYGSETGLKLLNEARKQGLSLIHASGLRLGLVVADGRTFVYTPKPLCMEEPNEIRSTLDAMTIDPNQLMDSEAIQGAVANNGSVCATDEQIDASLQDLKARPPVEFDIARQTRVFSALFEFVELTVTGCDISKRTIPLDSKLIGLAETKAGTKTRTTIKLFDGMGSREELNDKAIRDARTQIERDYLIKLPGYGSIIDKSLRPDFDKQIDDLKKKVENYRHSVVSTTHHRVAKLGECRCQYT